jgi:hypothetical protein
MNQYKKNAGTKHFIFRGWFAKMVWRRTCASLWQPFSLNKSSYRSPKNQGIRGIFLTGLQGDVVFLG